MQPWSSWSSCRARGPETGMYKMTGIHLDKKAEKGKQLSMPVRAGVILEKIARESLFWIGDRFEQIPERYEGAI